MNDTPQQIAIYDNVANGVGHTLIVARAGSGKTTTIERALAVVPKGQRCLFVAFAKTNANELKRRLGGRAVDVATCHSFGLRVLRESMGVCDVDHDRGLKLARRLTGNRTEQYAIVKASGLAKGLLLERASEIEEACDEFGVEMGDYPERFCRLVVDHLALSSSALAGEVDYDDMCWLPLELGLETPTYDYVFIDEFQDLVLAQLELALKACAPGGRIIAVGDDQQACYTFRGADRNVLAKLRARLKPTELPLSVTFRCARSIVRLANRFVPDLRACEGAPEGSVNENVPLQEAMGAVDYGDFVLSRTNAPLVRTALQLLKTDCRAVILGRDIGSSLTTLIYKLRATSPADLVSKAATWAIKERARQMAKDPPRKSAAELAGDKVECLAALAEGARSVDDVLAKVKALYVNSAEGGWWKHCVTLATTHRAKGLERDRVFVLWDTYLRPRDGIVSDEERRLVYVAVTRAKNTLYLVRGTPGREKS